MTTIDGWDGQKYTNNSQPQIDAALEILQRSGLQPTSYQRILDFGCGSGQISYFMAKKGASVLALDNSESMINEAKKLQENSTNLKFELIKNDLFKPEWDNSFDKVTSFACLHWIADKQNLFRKIYAVLKPEGLFIGTMAAYLPKTPLQEAIVQLSEKSQSKKVIQSIKEDFFPLTTSQLKQLLEHAGFTVDDIYLDIKKLTFYSKQDFINWLDGWLNAFSVIRNLGAQRLLFIAQLVDIYGALYPSMVEKKSYHYEWPCIIVVARKE